MPILTQTITKTSDLTVVASTPDTSTTVTSTFSTTLQAIPGQSITINLPRPEISSTNITKDIPTSTLTTTTVTAIELNVFLLDYNDNLYSIWTIDNTPSLPSNTGLTVPRQLVYVVEHKTDGWDSWPAGSKAGLIVGLALSVLLFLALIFCWYRRRNFWITHNWFPSTQGPKDPVTGRPLVQPTFVPGPLVPANATPYGYRHPATGEVYGMRGGMGNQGKKMKVKRLLG